MRRARAATERSGKAEAGAAEQLRLLTSQVEQWREHGALLSEHVRSLQAELKEEREANGRMRQLLRAQEEKIALLESMQRVATQPSSAASTAPVTPPEADGNLQEGAQP